MEFSMGERLDELIAQMTLEEKVGMLAGSDGWHIPGVERLGIPTLKVTDGPVGARGSKLSGGPRSACFPCGTALAATWDPEIVGRVGAALAEETKLKGAQVLLAPTTNIHRTPLAGRNFECFSEDPHLSARMTVAYIKGLQTEGVASCVKHYLANDQEFERGTISSEVDERTLREIYLPPFEAAIREAGSWSIMGSYNRLNGTYANEHPWLLTTVLRGEWDWDGFVVSDWGGTHSTAEAINAGLDCEMPGPSVWRAQKLIDAVKAGEVSDETVDTAVRRLLLVRERTGILEPGWVRPVEGEQDKPEHRVLIRQAGIDAIVLLKNDGVLPLQPGTLNRVAIIGPNAGVARLAGGGSAGVRHHPAQTPMAALAHRLGPGVEVVHELGCDVQRGTEPAEIPMVAEFFGNTNLDGEVLETTTSDSARFFWFPGEVPGVEAGQLYSARLTGTFVAEVSGPHELVLTSLGTTRLFLDGEEVIDNWTSQDRGDSFFGHGSAPKTSTRDLQQGTSVQVVVEFAARTPVFGGVIVGVRPPMPDDLMESAVATAKDADVAVVVVGMSGDWESEGHDRESMDLPGRQDELIAKVAAANPNTVVLVNAGSPVTMPWDDAPAAIAQCWYLGEEMGPALAAFLCGDRDASGRLPTTIPRRLEDTPAFTNYPGENGKVRYGEGIFVGYRWYDERKIEPRYPFGHGLSYANYDYGTVDAVRSGETVTVAVPVTNTSGRDGREVVQVYVADLGSRLSRPPQELKGFAKIDVPAGATVTATVELDRAAFRYFDEANGGWVVEPGEFEIRVGRSSRDIRGTATITYD